MYSEKLALAVKHNGRVLREHGDAVHIPFGSEYSIHLKNLNSLRALVRIWVDGQEATEGTNGLIVPPNQSVDLERFIKNGNLATGNRFKFIERTAKIEDGPRGIKADDGLIRIEFEFEKQPAKIEDVYTRRHFIDDYWNSRPIIWNGPVWYSSNQTFGSATSDAYTLNASASTAATSTSFTSTASTKPTQGSPLRGLKMKGATLSSEAVVGQNAATSDIGITVPGSVSEQKFDVGAWFPTDGQKHAMVLRLLGVVGKKEVKKPVTVKTKQKCTTCGHVNKSGAKFCSECGTGLELVG